MNDPWAGVRDGKYSPEELDAEVDVYLAIEVEPLLTDADALLAVVRTINVHDDCTVCQKAIAALPEHLK